MTETLQAITDAYKKRGNRPFGITVGLTEFQCLPMAPHNKLFSISVVHNGNMGNTIAQVDENLKYMHLPSIGQMKADLAPADYSETGHPDYHYRFVAQVKLG